VKEVLGGDREELWEIGRSREMEMGKCNNDGMSIEW